MEWVEIVPIETSHQSRKFSSAYQLDKQGRSGLEIKRCDIATKKGVPL
jgi:hypothetical protein